MQGRALAADVREPDRQVVRAHRVDLGRRGGAQPAVDRLQEQAARVAGAADERVAGGGVRDGPQARGLGRAVQHAPGDEGRAAEDQDVAGLVGAGDQLLGQGVDRAPAHQGAGGGEVRQHPAGGLDARHQRRKLVGGGARLRGQGLVPAGEVEQRVGGHGRRRVDDAAAAQGVVGDRLGRPVAGRAGRLRGVPGQEGQQLAAVARLGVAAGAGPHAAAVAVEQARARGRAVGLHRTQGGDHGRHVHRGHLVARGDRRQGGQDPGPPGDVDVVLERARVRGAHLVGDAGPRQDRAVVVDRHGLDRRGADVDPDGDGHPGSSSTGRWRTPRARRLGWRSISPASS